MDTVLTWFIRMWIGIGVALNVAAAGLVIGVWKELEIFRPFSVANLVAQVIVFSPAVLAYTWREKRRAKTRSAHAAPHAGSQADFRFAERDDKAGLRGDTRSDERDDRAGLRRDTRSDERDQKVGSRGGIRSAERDERFERIFENFPPKRPI
jgi:hypothetical protein